ncbi:MAG: hypothetical protein BM562_00700 [Alphaproteobacteria bacterium MedPE-SWcel]|nr:MAG: hypothetical protein BM562_00700 [Alphaproteobacteria bacterium MedPE-SWcel]
MIAVLMVAGLMAASATAGEARPSLRDVPEIENPLFAVAVASEVAETCDQLAPRTLKGLNQLYKIRSRANALGYSDNEIKAYVKSDQEKARMRAKGTRLLMQEGVKLDQPETFCTYGMAEIEKNSAIGVLLRAK